MQTLAVVSKFTKKGLSVWYFVKTDTGFAAFGGVDPKCKTFTTIEELRSCYSNWLRYGYQPGIASVPEVKTPRPRKVERPSRPVDSQLPLDLQEDLWALPSVV
jgi:hypothetical protein